jgi:hypothetical protein
MPSKDAESRLILWAIIAVGLLLGLVVGLSEVGQRLNSDQRIVYWFFCWIE